MRRVDRPQPRVLRVVAGEVNKPAVTEYIDRRLRRREGLDDRRHTVLVDLVEERMLQLRARRLPGALVLWIPLPDVRDERGRRTEGVGGGGGRSGAGARRANEEGVGKRGGSALRLLDRR